MPQLTKREALAVKELLWNGHPPGKVASWSGVRAPSITAIINGKAHGDVEWPDGNTGPMNPKRREEVYKQNGRVRDPLPEKSPVWSNLRADIDKQHDHEEAQQNQWQPEEQNPTLNPADIARASRIAREHQTRKEKQEQQINQMVEIVSHQQEEEFLKGITDIGEDERPAFEAPSVDLEKMLRIPWEQIRHLQDNPLVALASIDEELQKTLEIAFANMQKEHWYTQYAWKSADHIHGLRGNVPLRYIEMKPARMKRGEARDAIEAVKNTKATKNV